MSRNSLTRRDFLKTSASRPQEWPCSYKGIRGYSDVEIGCSSVAICLLGEIGTRLNRPLKWDPKRWRFPEDREAQALVKRDSH